MSRKLPLAWLVTTALAALLLACGSDIPAGPALTATQTPPSAAVSTATPAPPATPTPTIIPAQFPYTVTDSRGTDVTFEKPPERIVAFDSAVVEILFAIGEGDRVVGTHSFVSHPPEVESIPRVGDAFNMNIEATVGLDPDLVFVFSDGSIASLENAGLKVLYQKNLEEDFPNVAEKIRLWGRITGSPAAAEEIAADFEARVRKIRASLAQAGEGPSVFQDVGGLWTPGPNTLVGEVFDLLKLRNIAHDVSGYAQLSPEVIVQRNPDIIIAVDPEAITGNSAFKEVLAVRNGRVYKPSSDALDVAGPRFVEGIEELAALVYPSLAGGE